MNDIKDNAYEILNQLYYNGIKPLIVEKENYAYIRDPIFGIKRNRNYKSDENLKIIL